MRKQQAAQLVHFVLRAARDHLSLRRRRAALLLRRDAARRASSRPPRRSARCRASLSWFIDAYPQFAHWKATVDRLTGFAASLERVRARSASSVERRARRGAGASASRWTASSSTLPQGKPLLARDVARAQAAARTCWSPARRAPGKSHALPRARRHLALLERAHQRCRRARACCSCRRSPICRSARSSTR